jgi:hypothetical protein
MTFRGGAGPFQEMADLREIEALARLRLVSRRAQVDVRVAVAEDTRELIEFCGLEEVLSPLYAPRLAFRPRHWTRADDVGARWPR